MNTVLIITGRYLPGYKDGGPVRSILNLTDWLGDEADFRIMCLDRDHGDDKRYPDIRLSEWNQVGKAKVWYVRNFDEIMIEKLASEADVIYCCGPYSDYAIMTMKLKKSGRIKAPLVIASMGSFSPDAYAIKGYKKKLFIAAMKMLKMFDDVTWSVTSKREEAELKAVIGGSAKCVIASDLSRKGVTAHKGVKQNKALSIVFISRISRKKNLKVIPDILEKMDSSLNISIDIYGVAEDMEYLNECLAKFRRLPDNIKWEYRGELDSADVPKTFAKYDVFLFPTLGENYGHVIAESMAAGCVPVISNRTPWMDLDENGCGRVCRLEQLDTFSKALEELANVDSGSFIGYRGNCYSYIESVNKESLKNSGYRKFINLDF